MGDTKHRLSELAGDIDITGPLKPTGNVDGIPDDIIWNAFVQAQSLVFRRAREGDDRTEPTPQERRFAAMVVSQDRRNFSAQPLSITERRNYLRLIQSWGFSLTEKGLEQ